MGLTLSGTIQLPANRKNGGFDHAAIHEASGKLYVAHTANDSVDVIDARNERYLHSIPNLTEVAGALVSDERSLVFTSNRGENTVGIFTPDNDLQVLKVSVGVKPNGLAYDPKRNLLLAANVGDPAISGSQTISIVEVAERRLVCNVPVPGRTRWTVYDPSSDTFFVNIADPACIVTIDAKQPTQIERTFGVPSTGPHGLDLDAANNRLFCACDGKKLFCLDSRSGSVASQAPLGGVPDVIFFNTQLCHLYVAIGDPGVIEVFDTQTLRQIETVHTEKGAHTIAFEKAKNKVYAFLPNSHRAAVYSDG
jgi:DNA-binding beta-propeller fold protein YncE